MRALKTPQRNTAGRLIPTGTCWFCGKQLKGKRTFFCHGHDKAATGRLILEEFGSVADLLASYGYFPGGPKTF